MPHSESVHIIFDLDGTLIDSKGEITHTYQLVLRELPPPKPVNLDLINPGAPLTQIMSLIYGEDPQMVKRAKHAFATSYDNSEYHETGLYDGVPEILTVLTSEGFHLHVATNKRLVPTQAILKKKGLAKYFTGVVASEMTPGSQPEKHQMIGMLKKQFGFPHGFMVGDMVSDIEAGNQEKMKTVAVTYGYGSRETLAAANPSFMIDSLHDLPNLVRRL